MQRKFTHSVFGDAENFFRSLMHVAPLPMFVMSEGNCIYGNERFIRLHGCADDFCATCGLEHLLGQADQEAVGHALASLKPGSVVRLPLQLLQAEGKVSAVDLSMSSLQIENKSFVLGVISEKTEKERLRRLLDRLAFHDSLTELPNRILLFDRINQALSHAARDGGSFALVVLDLDGFKAVNDELGHAAGDAILREVSRRLRACVRGADTVARLGGDEFAVVLHGVGNENEARIVLNKMIRDVAVPFELGSNQVGVHASLGIAFCPLDGATIQELLGRADFAMYAAKKSGGDAYCVSTGEIGETAFRHALEPLINNIRLGFELIDAQHEEIVACLRGLLAALSGNETRAELKWRADYLQHLTEAHFHTEEDLILRYAIRDQAQHRVEHENLLGQLEDLLHEPGSYGMTVLAHAMNDWLLPHIETLDAELVAQLKAAGVSG